MLNFLILILAIPGMLLRGWVITYLWKWFMVPLGIVDISLPHAIGISVIISFLISNVIKKDQTKEEQIYGLVLMFLWPLIALGLGWIVNCWM